VLLEKKPGLIQRDLSCWPESADYYQQWGWNGNGAKPFLQYHQHRGPWSEWICEPISSTGSKYVSIAGAMLRGRTVACNKYVLKRKQKQQTSCVLHGVSCGLRLPSSSNQDRANSPPHRVLCFVLHILQETACKSDCAPGAGFNSLEILSPGGLPLSWCLAILSIVRSRPVCPAAGGTPVEPEKSRSTKALHTCMRHTCTNF